MTRNIKCNSLTVHVCCLKELGDVEQEAEYGHGHQVLEHPLPQGFAVVRGLAVVQRVVDSDVSENKGLENGSVALLGNYLLVII